MAKHEKTNKRSRKGKKRTEIYLDINLGDDKSSKNVKIQKKRYIIPECHIPKAKFERALEILKSPKFDMPLHDYNCHIPVHATNEIRHALRKRAYPRLLAQARICLLRRDWKNLAKLLSVAKPVEIMNSTRFYAIFVKYALICLKHSEDNGLLNVFLQGVMSCNTEKERVELWHNLSSVK